MNDIEARLRDAFAADTRTVRPETIKPFGHRDVAAPSAWRSGAAGASQHRVAIPVAAAVSIALIAVGATVGLPSVLSGHDDSQSPTARSIAPGYLAGQIPAAVPPRFIAAVTQSHNGDTIDIKIIDSATGKVVGTLASPRAHQQFHAVAALGGDRRFIAETTGVRCDTWFYQFRLTAAGKPVGLTPFAVPSVAGRANFPASLAISSDGRELAYSTDKCAQTGIRRYAGQVGVIDLATTKITMWRFRWPAGPTSLSLSANGKLLEMVSNPSSGRREQAVSFNRAWLIRTGSPSGPLSARYRRVIGPPGWPTSAILSPTGAMTWALLPSYHKHQPRWHVALAAFRTAAGRQIGVWHTFPRLGSLDYPTLNPDTSGRYILVSGFDNAIEKLDVATGRLTHIPGTSAYRAFDVAW